MRRSSALSPAALVFAGATAYNSVIAVREDLPGEPLGFGLPLSVATGTLAGWGSAVAAPWPMPVVGLLAARRRGQDKEEFGPGLICTGLGIAGIVGILIEPNTYRAREWAPATRRAVVLHIGACAVLAGAGVWEIARARRERGK